jgi:hypothetical protein
MSARAGRQTIDEAASTPRARALSMRHCNNEKRAMSTSAWCSRATL